MRVINAQWEMRNLGVTCEEIIIEVGDSIVLIDSELSKLSSSYRVIKIPCSRPDLLLYLQGRGYIFIEMLSTCSHDGELPQLTSLQQRIYSNLSCSLATSDDLNAIFEELMSGMFTTDRVAIDPKFGIPKAGKRYCGWVKDELTRGAQVFMLNYKNMPIGFFVMRLAEDKKCHAFLGGIFPGHKGGGFGYFLNYFEVIKGMELGASKIITTFSSNNTSIASVHYSLGCRLVHQQYILVRHV